MSAGFGAGAPRRASAAPSDLPRADRPEEIGFSAERLARITAWLNREVERGEIPGAVVAIGRKGKLAYLEAVGYRDREANASMRQDSVFGIASMTKPITSLALMMLAEEGRVQLGHPVANYLPELRDQKVAVPQTSTGQTDMVLEPAAQPTTV